MQRVSFYIDGFNVYHKIDEYQSKTGICYKWLDYKSLLTSLLKPNQSIQDIYFFTAISKFRGEESVVRHNKYITALQNIGLKVITGKFITTYVSCKVKKCNYYGNRTFPKAEEKKSDVNLAINMVLDAVNDKYDKCFLLSSDSDFVPALERVKQIGKKTGLLIPPQDKIVKVTKNDELKNTCLDKLNDIISLKFDELSQHILPTVVCDPKTNISVTMPDSYMTSEIIKNIIIKNA